MKGTQTRRRIFICGRHYEQGVERMILFGDRDDVALRFVFEAKARPRIARATASPSY